MSKIGLFYSFNSHKTKKIGELIAEMLGEGATEAVNAETVTGEQFMQYERLILGVPTWFDGELPNYWDEFVPALEDMDLTGKKVALYGLADQVGYPENFGDAVGLMARLLRSLGAVIVGETSTEGYTYESSRAVENGQFLGLILDQENQGRLTEGRVQHWLEQLKASM
jgi:flavodoxin I